MLFPTGCIGALPAAWGCMGAMTLDSRSEANGAALPAVTGCMADAGTAPGAAPADAAPGAAPAGAIIFGVSVGLYAPGTVLAIFVILTISPCLPFDFRRFPKLPGFPDGVR